MRDVLLGHSLVVSGSGREREGIWGGPGLVDWQEICLLFPSLPGKTPELWIIAIRPHPPHLLPAIKPTTETPNNKASTQHGAWLPERCSDLSWPIEGTQTWQTGACDQQILFPFPLHFLILSQFSRSPAAARGATLTLLQGQMNR